MENTDMHVGPSDTKNTSEMINGYIYKLFTKIKQLSKYIYLITAF